MVPAEQDLGDLPSPVVGRSGVHRLFEQTITKRLALGRPGVAHHAWEETGNPLDAEGCRHLAAGEDEIPDGDLFVDEVVYHPLVDTFEAPADEGDLGEIGPPVQGVLGEGGANRGEQTPIAP